MSIGALENGIYLVAMIKIVISFTWMIVHLAQHDDGRGLAPLHRVLQHLLQAQGGRRYVAGRPAADDDQRRADRLREHRGPRRGRRRWASGKLEDFAWKGILDFTSCTECGRCQSQCPAWNTEKPLSPKLLITNLRDHAYAKAPYLLADPEERDSLPDEVKAAAERQLVGATEGDPTLPSGGAVIDPEVLWNCTSCGACVQQCPVDIEHVDHIIDMRRYQVLIESSFPSELNGLFKGLENKGNPWNMSPNARMDWAKDLDFAVKQVGH